MACGTLTGEQRRANERRCFFFPPPRRYRRSTKSKKRTRVREFFGMGIITPGCSRCNKLSEPRAHVGCTGNRGIHRGRWASSGLFIFTGPGPLGKPVICSFNPAVARRCVRSFQLETALCSTSREHTSKFFQSLFRSSSFCSVDVITDSLLCIRSLFSGVEVVCRST